MKLKLMTIPAAALAATFVFAQSAQAREHHRHRGLHRDASRHWSRAADPYGRRQELGQEFGQEFAGSSWNGSQPETSRSGSGNGLGGRPSAWFPFTAGNSDETKVPRVRSDATQPCAVNSS